MAKIKGPFSLLKPIVAKHPAKSKVGIFVAMLALTVAVRLNGYSLSEVNAVDIFQILVASALFSVVMYVFIRYLVP